MRHQIAGPLRHRSILTGPALLLFVGSVLAPTAVLRAQEVFPDTVCLALVDSARNKATTNDSVRSRSRACTWKADSTRTAIAAREAADAMGDALTMAFTIPESGDEQRLDDGTGALGPTAHIYSSPFSNGFVRRAQIEAHGKPGLFIGVVKVDAVEGTVLPHSYQDLKLEPGVNCIYLEAAPGSTKYLAWVTSTVRSKCSRDNPRGPLFVDERQAYHVIKKPSPIQPAIALPPTGALIPILYRHGDYPAAARFGDDASGHIPLLGFKCLDAWCEIGPTAGFVRRAPWVTPTNRESRIKGWHDEQWLVERDTSGVWEKKVRANLTPEPRIDRYDKASFTGSGHWVKVATVTLLDDPAGTKYYAWGLRAGSNLIELNFDGAKWQVRVTNSDHTRYVWKHVVEMPHVDVAVPGSARFRWTEDDDGIWVPCGQSCCRADGE